MSKFQKILIGLIVGAVILVGAFVGTLMYMQKSDAKAKEAKEAKPKVEKTAFHKIANPIISNLVDDKRVNVRVIPTLEYAEDKKFEEELKEDDSAATEAIILVLRRKTVAQVTDPQAPSNLKDEVIKELNHAYHTDKFINVYFKEFITQ